jgi:hypothetical protein
MEALEAPPGSFLEFLTSMNLSRFAIEGNIFECVPRLLRENRGFSILVRNILSY